METKIIKLSEEVINQIAAGEVIESPVSVVKELVENSLDAKAKRIAIALKGGGLEEIRIDDDGVGMSRSDALMSLERHATSKIRTSSDLFRLTTLGFRGEALASIAAISHFDMKTSQDILGTHITANGGKIQRCEPVARNLGTTMTISSLFYNVPARKKFQKSPSALTAQVRKMVETTAMAHPHVAFSLQIEGQKVLELFSQEKKERIETILSSFAHEVKESSCWGLFGSPQEAKSHRKGQYLFVNGRAIFSPLVSQAVKEGYGTRLKDDLHPTFVLFLQIPPDQMDVNVHPQKKEVRFCEESTLFKKIRAWTLSAFEKTEVHSSFVFSPPELSSFWKLAEEPPCLPSLRNVEPLSMPLEFSERPLGVFGNLFLLEKGSLFVVDLSAAASRIRFEAVGDPHKLQRVYTVGEAMEIWKKLHECRDSLYDPAGKRIWKEVTPQDLQDWISSTGR